MKDSIRFGIFWLWLAVSLSICAQCQLASKSLILPDHRSVEAQFAEDVRKVPLAAQSSVSRVLGRDLPIYRARRVLGAFTFTNEPHELSARFTRKGVRLRRGAWHWGMSLSGYGYGTNLKTLHRVDPVAGVNRVEYKRGDLTEWYINGPLGLEQGFTIARRPSRASTQPLTILLSLSGNLQATANQGSGGVTLRNSAGEAALDYAGLNAFDAAGRELRSSLEVNNDRLLLKVDDTKAIYPVVIDPWVQMSTLRASNGRLTAAFGFSAAMDGDTIVVGSPYIGNYKGEAYVFVRPANGWNRNMTETARLSTSDGGKCTQFTGCQFGYSVAISGDSVAIGTGADRGNDYVFVKPAMGWKTTSKFNAKLVANIGNTRVAIQGNCVVAGAALAGNGAAFVFVRPAGGWKGVVHKTATLTASDGKFEDEFGFAVGNEGDVIAVGALRAGTSCGSGVRFRQTGRRLEEHH